MGKRKKLWTSMSAVTFAGVTVLSACSTDVGGEGEGEAQSAAVEEAQMSAAMPDAGEGEGESGGEGEGEGEGEGAGADVDLATDDLAYLTHLGLMRGHLFVGNALYQAGHVEHAKTHMKHPESELYGDIEPAFATRGGEGFASQLEALANAVEGEQGDRAVADAYAAVTNAIANHEGLVAEANASAVAKLKLVAALLRVAGEEYGIAVVDGKMENAHEYQDAYGFTQIAKAIVGGAANNDATAATALDKVAGILAGLDGMWPTLIPPETLETEAGQLYGAASQVELLALGLE